VPTSPTLPAPVAAVVAALGAVRVPWAIAGGWAIDLALGRTTRAHGDVDVALFRDDQAALRRTLAGWTFDAVVAGRRVPWPADEWLRAPVHEVHASPPTGGPALELLLNERDGDDWVYRRDPRVRRPLSRAMQRGPSGVPLLAPEVVLLYKSKAPRAADEHDLAVARGLLDAESRAWLRGALALTAPGHGWTERLAATG
jgi:hypothetical protein